MGQSGYLSASNLVDMQTLLVAMSADGIVEIILNRPEKKNAINNLMWRELAETLASVDVDPDARVVVLSGAGGAFCSGADLSGKDLGQGDGLARMRSINEVALMLHNLSKPTIAKVTGIAAGAGCNLALGCDLILASASARFSEIFVRRGLSIDFGGSFLLPRLVGMQRAKELAFFGDIIDAQTAKDIGLVNRVFDDEVIDEQVHAWATRLASGPPIALGLIKSQLNQSFSRTMAQALEFEALSQAINFQTHDTNEAIAGFLEKRPVTFRGN